MRKFLEGTLALGAAGAIGLSILSAESAIRHSIEAKHAQNHEIEYGIEQDRNVNIGESVGELMIGSGLLVLRGLSRRTNRQ